MEAYIDIIINSKDRIVVLDLQERLIEMKNGNIREIRDIAERKEVLAGSDWEFMAELVL